MTDDSDNIIRLPSNRTPEHKAALKAGFEHLVGLTKKPEVDANKLFQELAQKLSLCNAEIQGYVKPMIDAGALRDKCAMEEQLFSLYLHSSHRFSKDELEAFFAWMMTGTAMSALYPTELGQDPQMPKF